MSLFGVISSPSCFRQ